MKMNLLSQKNKYLSIIYKDVLAHKPIKEIHDDLYKATVNPNKVLLSYMVKVANNAKKLDKGAGAYYTTGLEILAVSLLQMFKTDACQYKSTLIANSEVRKYVAEEKSEILVNAWKENRAGGKIFYVASKHSDCAEDHKDYQGKVYVDRYWHNYDTDGSISKYVKDNNIKTVQWVTGEPVWFVTRPNCRHYFVAYTPEQIMKGKYNTPKRRYGDRRLQTPQKANVAYYEDRLKMLLSLQKQYKTTLLTNQIEKTKLLISKIKKTF